MHAHHPAAAVASRPRSGGARRCARSGRRGRSAERAGLGVLDRLERGAQPVAQRFEPGARGSCSAVVRRRCRSFRGGLSVIGGLFLARRQDSPCRRPCCRGEGAPLVCAATAAEASGAGSWRNRAGRRGLSAARRARGAGRTSDWRGRWLTPSAASVGHHGPPADGTKRDFLKLVAGAGAAIGAAAIAWTLIDSMNPSKDVLALSVGRGRPDARSPRVRASPSLWQGKPIFVRHRTAEEIKEAEDVPARRADRAAGRLGAGEGRPRPMDRADRHLHASRLHAAGQQADRSARRLGRLVLPLPRQPVRHLGARAPRAGAAEPGLPPYAFETDTKIKIG